ncbi:hypothetical protein CERSUDRAFT_119571 [Gelatoporia subvermispora B]|uniref:Uncharacterized protein n=1 Tax=Ceriporiopsis subvermispora (strain B) TaxID=914234 RepID=M2R0D8_CERS8|nr:hypothetical protein CERSUDRAFT_119571 [Gelatoporia subvermispora B]
METNIAINQQGPDKGQKHCHSASLSAICGPPTFITDDLEPNIEVADEYYMIPLRPRPKTRSATRSTTRSASQAAEEDRDPVTPVAPSAIPFISQTPTELIDHMWDLHNDNTELRKQVRDLRRQVQEIQVSIFELKSQVFVLKASTAACKANNCQFNSQLTNLRNHVLYLRQMVDDQYVVWVDQGERTTCLASYSAK